MGKNIAGPGMDPNITGRFLTDGFHALKWSPFGYAAHSMTPEQEHVTVECVRRVREAVGPDVHLMVAAYNPASVKCPWK